MAASGRMSVNHIGAPFYVADTWDSQLVFAARMKLHPYTVQDIYRDGKWEFKCKLPEEELKRRLDGILTVRRRANNPAKRSAAARKAAFAGWAQKRKGGPSDPASTDAECSSGTAPPVVLSDQTPSGEPERSSYAPESTAPPPPPSSKTRRAGTWGFRRLSGSTSQAWEGLRGLQEDRSSVASSRAPHPLAIALAPQPSLESFPYCVSFQ